MQNTVEILDADPDFHAFGVRDVVLDFVERFGADAFLAVLRDTLTPLAIEVQVYAAKRKAA